MQQRPENQPQQQWRWDGNDQPPTQPYAPYQQQYTIPPQQPKKKSHIARNILLGTIGFFVAVGAISAAVSGAKTPTSPAAAATSTAVAHPAAATSAVHAAAPTVVLTQSGNGMVTTSPFTVAADWSLTYTFNCASFGQAGNFIVYVDYPSGATIANSLATSGGTTTYQTDAAGTHSMLISSECDWTIKVTDNS